MRRCARICLLSAVLVGVLALPAGALTSASYAATDPRFAYSSSTVVADPQATTGRLVLVPAGASVTFWVTGTNAIHLIDVANGAGLSISLDDRRTAFNMRLPATGAHGHRTIVQWGMAGGMEHLAITVTSGVLALDRIWLYADGSPMPSLVEASEARRLPLLSVFGDSIADGQNTAGPVVDSTGWAEVLGRLRGIRVTNQSLGGMTATCWGRQHVSDVVARNPAAVIVAFGINDLARFGCDSSLASFTSALGSIVDELHVGLPGAPIYVSAILPAGNPAFSGQISKWNRAIRHLAAGHAARYVDPSAALTRWTDYSRDQLHPDTAGHAKLGAFWSRTLPA